MEKNKLKTSRAKTECVEFCASVVGENVNNYSGKLGRKRFNKV